MNSITKYINFYEIIKRRNSKYPFAIFNSDKENEPGVHWWSFMDIHPKNKLFLFDSFGIEGFKLCTMKFCVETWQKMSQKRKDKLTNTAQNFFHLLEQFAKLKKKIIA